MAGKILVTYASRGGATAGVAEEIGQTLADRGIDVEVRPMHEVQNLDPYSAVVAGSAIQGGAWPPEAVQFVQKNRAALDEKRCALFLVCGDAGDAFRRKHRQFVRPDGAGAEAGQPRRRRALCRRFDLHKVPHLADRPSSASACLPASGRPAITATGRLSTPAASLPPLLGV